MDSSRSLNLAITLGRRKLEQVYLEPDCKVLEELPGLLLFINVLV
jgi:hypothetical protein